MNAKPSRPALIREATNTIFGKKPGFWEQAAPPPARDIILRTLAVSLIVVFTVAMVYVKASEHYTFNWSVLVSFRNAFFMGFLMTMKISVVTLLTSVIFGTLIGLAGVSRIALLRDLSKVYIETLRNLPLLVIVLLVYFGMGNLFHLSSFPAAVIALTAFESTFFAEIIRGGIQSIGMGQMLAGRSLGLSHGMTMRSIILPQAVRRVVPSLAGQFINLVKDSSLASVISLVELTLIGRQIMTATFASFETYVAIALFYFLICFILSRLSDLLKKKVLVE